MHTAGSSGAIAAAQNAREPQGTDFLPKPEATTTAVINSAIEVCTTQVGTGPSDNTDIASKHYYIPDPLLPDKSLSGLQPASVRTEWMSIENPQEVVFKA